MALVPVISQYYDHISSYTCFSLLREYSHKNLLPFIALKNCDLFTQYDIHYHKQVVIVNNVTIAIYPMIRPFIHL